MLLPADFSSIIADHFYDKDVNLLESTQTSVDGWVDEDATTIKSTFKANVQFDRLGDVQAELGLTDSIDVSVTCLTSVPIETGDLFSYLGVTYKASAVVLHDSHYKIAGTKWV